MASHQCDIISKIFHWRNISTGMICRSWKLLGNIFSLKGEQLRLNQLLTPKRGAKFARGASAKYDTLSLTGLVGMMEWSNGGISYDNVQTHALNFLFNFQVLKVVHFALLSFGKNLIQFSC